MFARLYNTTQSMHGDDMIFVCAKCLLSFKQKHLFVGVFLSLRSCYTT